MYSSFYTASLAAMGEQEKLNVVSNNLANVNTAGFKAKVPTFQDLIYYNLNNYDGEETRIKAGAGIRLEKADTNFEPAGFDLTGGAYDFAILEDGFFMLRNPTNNEITYTRNGCFSLSQREDGRFYLVSDSGNLVLDQNRNPIRMVQDQYGENALEAQPAIYDFQVKNGMENVGKNEYVPVEKNGQPILQQEEALQGALETSNTDVATEFVRMIQAQRAYSYALKMVTTSDEVVQTINGLR